MDRKEAKKLRKQQAKEQLERLMPIDSASKRLSGYFNSNIPSKKSIRPNKWTMYKGKPKIIMNKDSNNI